ncbi:FadR/GntR family transcriptional regulator [Roseibium aggregatum]|uniref:FadR family transcriptional regulator n=1 Tax=Roseibium aggregatum TaxID=187304 RepID=A0A939EGV9_9HYPH|nr:FadR/GntR family transcriptional regulator [Roseibium aggregatum]MBN9671978.1 FadR family transcriptional regulator [Roseibium aggregatum]
MQSIARTSLADSAADAIRTEIVRSRWPVGDKLPNEATLSQELSVSRGTVREAVRILVSQGFLETRQGSGTYVLSAVDTIGPLTMARRATLRDQFEARLALDAEAARLAAHRRTPEVIAELRRLLNERGNYDGCDKAAFVAKDFAFHKAVVAASQNSVLVNMYAFFSSIIGETIEATLGEELREPDMAAHASIVDAIETGDPDKAEAAVRRFMAPVLRDLERLLSS